MQKLDLDPRFQCPFGCMVVGPSMSGKSHFTLELVQNAEQFFNPPPERIIYAYGIWQKAFDNINNIEFVQGVDGLAALEFSARVPSLLIIDDLMEELCNNKELSVLFTREMHHKNITVFFLVQNLYKQGKSMRDVALNCQVLILFKSPRDTQQIKMLGRQLGIKGLETAYKESIKARYGYLIVNLQPSIPKELVLQTNLFDPHRKIFLPR